jgi:hypothetical protein
MSEKLLSEYQGVLKELEIIKNRVAVIKDVTQNKLKCAQSEDEKYNIFIDFKTQLKSIKKDKNIKHKYKNLVKRKKIIESEMLDKMSDEIPKRKNKNIQIIKRKKYTPLKYIQEVTEISEESERPRNIKPCIDVNKDISELISKYKKEVGVELDCYDSDHSYTSNKPQPKQCKTNTIIVQIPPQPCLPCQQQSTKKTHFSDSEKSEDMIIVKKKQDQLYKKNNIDDTKQVKKLCNLIKSLQCKIDE